MEREAAAQTARLARPMAALEVCPQPPVDSRERMPGQVAHDLLGIVTIIHGYASLVPTEPSNELQQEYCLRILHACRRMVDMVNRSLALSRQEAGVLALIKTKVNLPAFLGDCLAAQTLNAKRKGMVLILEIGSELPEVMIDAGSAERILANLLENAIKFSDPESTIRLKARACADSLQIEVQDDGPGIGEEEVATLFDAYRTGRARGTGGEPSTGLGLHIVKELVQAHHGVVGVRSELGRGTTFSVDLPLDVERRCLPGRETRAG